VTSAAEQLAIELGAPLGWPAEHDGKRLVPMLCGRDETGERVLGHEGWLFELKLDGVRIVADKRGAHVSLGYRTLRDATESYPEIAEAIRKLAEERVVLDGEVVAFDEEGKPDFQRLGSRIHAGGAGARRLARTVPVVYVVFDVLAVGERDVTGLPIEARKRILERILGEPTSPGALVRLHPTFEDGKTLFRLCREQGLEGVVAKRTGSTYRSGDRSAEWVKVKCELDADLVVVGWTEGEGRRSRLGALDVAAYDGDRLVLRGSVGSGLDEDQIDELLERLLALEVPKPVAVGKPTRVKRGRHFTRPELVVSVRYMGTSSEGTLRHPVFRGIRSDLAPEDCILPSTVAAASREGKTPRRRGTAPSTVVLSDGTTKGALCTYYEAVAPAMLPHLRGRICCPVRGDASTGGRGLPALPAWPLPEWTPSWVRTCVATREHGEVRGVIVDDVDTLRFLVEAGYASLLVTPVRESAPATSDFVALRIEGASAWRVALQARELIEATGLSPFVKGASALALDVLVPLGDAPAASGAALGALLAHMLAPAAVGLGVTVELLRAPVAPFAVVVPRVAGQAAAASLPLVWEELAADLDPGAGLDQVVRRLSEGEGSPDPMGSMGSLPVRFADAVKALERMVARAGEPGKGGSFVRDPAAR